MKESPDPIRVAIVEDHSAYREVISEIVEGTFGLELVGVFNELEGAIETIADADIILMDIGLPGMSGIEGAVLVKKKNPEVKIIMVTNYNDDERVFQAIASGADGYLLKKTSTAKIIEAINETMQGGAAMAPFIARRMLDVLKSRNTKVQNHSKDPGKPEQIALSEREGEVLGLLVEGMNYKSIAEKLFISPDTVRNHIRNIYEKLHVHSRSEAVAKAIRGNLI
jgi:DNA-binding NarL/FixJ family response regulator